MNTQSRKFGEIPAWAKEGFTTLRNYDYRAEAWCAQPSSDRGGIHPTINLKSPDFPLWFEYFARHLGGLPWAMKQLCENKTMSMTVPEQQPQWFDQEFMPKLGFVMRIPDGTTKDNGDYIAQHRANVFIRADNAMYPRMVERAKDADERDYRHEVNGIWVGRNWLGQDAKVTGKSFKQFTVKDLAAIYARNDRAAA